eukprot:Sdes_comp20550_c0_seq1m15279
MKNHSEGSSSSQEEEIRPKKSKTSVSTPNACSPSWVFRIFLVRPSLFCIWDVPSVLKLRKEWRIVGATIGTLTCAPNQNCMYGMPLCLLPEEVFFLCSQNVAVLIDESKRNSNPTQQDILDYHQMCAAEDRVLQNEILKKRMEKSAAFHSIGTLDSFKPNPNTISASSTRWHRFRHSLPASSLLHFYDQQAIVPHPESFFPVLINSKYQVFRDLWSRGYYLTGGSKFGGDFLVYKGDPFLYHSDFIVIILPHPDHLMSCMDLIRYGRLATSVRKKALLASVQGDRILYISLCWFGD